MRLVTTILTIGAKVLVKCMQTVCYKFVNLVRASSTLPSMHDWNLSLRGASETSGVAISACAQE